MRTGMRHFAPRRSSMNVARVSCSNASSFVDIARFAALSDNYGFALRCRHTGEVAIVDAPEFGAIERALETRAWPPPRRALVTHWHRDHVGAIEELRGKYPEMEVVAPRKERGKIPFVDRFVSDGDVVRVGAREARVVETPGHTAGSVCYHFVDDEVIFVGDTLFAAGCGKLFEGTPREMWDSISKILAMPDATEVYCAHEYTESNLRFALSVDVDNEALRERAKVVKEMRARGEPTVPTTVGVERETNPFCRPMSRSVQRGVGMEGSTDLAAVFGAVRRAKDKF